MGNVGGRKRVPGDAAPWAPQRVRGPVLAGVVPDQPLEIVHRAVELALSLDVKLICAYVDVTSYLSGESVTGPGDDSEGVSAGIRAGLELILNQAGVRWSFRTLSGAPVRALSEFAEFADVSIIIVGTREQRLGVRLEQLLVSSVAVELTHHRARPVLVVPLAR